MLVLLGAGARMSQAVGDKLKQIMGSKMSWPESLLDDVQELAALQQRDRLNRNRVVALTSSIRRPGGSQVVNDFIQNRDDSSKSTDDLKPPPTIHQSRPTISNPLRRFVDQQDPKPSTTSYPIVTIHQTG